MGRDFDVAIMGGGLAGLCLALQLKKTMPNLDVLVLERNLHPVTEAAFKVGESTVEASAHYFGNILGLENHIRESQLPKLGLRFFFKDPGSGRLGDGVEFGISDFFPTRSYQLDRGRFENYLGERVRDAGVLFCDGAKIEDFSINPAKEPHRLSYRHLGESHTVNARWLVDASGRAGMIKRELGLGRKTGHNVNAVWFRLNTVVKIDAFPSMADREGPTGRRWLSTNHLLGTGYWVWLIPLASGSTSIGIVADPRHHPLKDINRFDRALAWLEKHQPECGKVVAENRDRLQDFLAVKDFAMDADRVFSADRWALTGEAGLFLDPFYSPGSDFIAISNTMITTLIEKDFAGVRLNSTCSIYEQIYHAFFENTLDIYRDRYGLFGSTRVMSVKIAWDIALYWTFPAFFFCQNRFHDLGVYARLRNEVKRVNTINYATQRLFARWAELESETDLQPVFIDHNRIKTLYNLNGSLSPPLETDEAFDHAFMARVRNLSELSDEIFARAAARHPGLLETREGSTAPTRSHFSYVFEKLGL